MHVGPYVHNLRRKNCINVINKKLYLHIEILSMTANSLFIQYKMSLLKSNQRISFLEYIEPNLCIVVIDTFNIKLYVNVNKNAYACFF